MQDYSFLFYFLLVPQFLSSSILWKLPLRIPPPQENCPLWKFPPLENYPLWNPLPTYKSYKWKKKQNYKIFCLEESCAIQHPYENNQGPLWYTDDLTENTGFRYFLYRIKKIQKLTESEKHQVAFTCQLYKWKRTKTRQSNYKIWHTCETTK